MLNTTNGTTASDMAEWYVDYTDSTSTSLLSMSYPGLGLPNTVFNQFKTQIEFVTDNGFSCDNETLGGYCTANLDCGIFFPTTNISNNTYGNLTGFSFRIGLMSSNQTYANLPLTSLMRCGETAGELDCDICNLYVMNVDSDYPPSDYFILGVPYL